MVLHDINQAIHYSDNIIGMKQGKVIVEGKANEVITQDVLKEIYDIDLQISNLDQHSYVMTV